MHARGCEGGVPSNEIYARIVGEYLMRYKVVGHNPRIACGCPSTSAYEHQAEAPMHALEVLASSWIR